MALESQVDETLEHRVSIVHVRGLLALQRDANGNALIDASRPSRARPLHEAVDDELVSQTACPLVDIALMVNAFSSSQETLFPRIVLLFSQLEPCSTEQRVTGFPQ